MSTHVPTPEQLAQIEAAYAEVRRRSNDAVWRTNDPPVADLDDTALRTRERCPVCDRPALLTWSDSAGAAAVCRGGHDEPEESA